MNTQYVTFILRLRLDGEGPQGMADHRIHGSVQQVGLQEIQYFDSPEKLQATLQGLLPAVTIPAENTGQSHAEETRS